MRSIDEQWLEWCIKTAKQLREAVAQAELLHGAPLDEDPMIVSMKQFATQLEEAAEAMHFLENVLFG